MDITRFQVLPKPRQKKQRQLRGAIIQPLSLGGLRIVIQFESADQSAFYQVQMAVDKLEDEIDAHLTHLAHTLNGAGTWRRTFLTRYDAKGESVTSINHLRLDVPLPEFLYHNPDTFDEVVVGCVGRAVLLPEFGGRALLMPSLAVACENPLRIQRLLQALGACAR